MNYEMTASPALAKMEEPVLTLLLATCASVPLAGPELTAPKTLTTAALKLAQTMECAWMRSMGSLVCVILVSLECSVSKPSACVTQRLASMVDRARILAKISSAAVQRA